MASQLAGMETMIRDLHMSLLPMGPVPARGGGWRGGRAWQTLLAESYVAIQSKKRWFKTRVGGR